MSTPAPTRTLSQAQSRVAKLLGLTDAQLKVLARTKAGLNTGNRAAAAQVLVRRGMLGGGYPEYHLTDLGETTLRRARELGF